MRKALLAAAALAMAASGTDSSTAPSRPVESVLGGPPELTNGSLFLFAHPDVRGRIPHRTGGARKCKAARRFARTMGRRMRRGR